MNDLVAIIIISCWLLGVLGTLSFVFYGLYLRKTVLHEVELMFRGYDIMSSQVYFSLLACIQYGGAFTSRFLAKRSKMLEARERVPVYIQKKFIFAFWLFFISGFIFFISGYFASKLN